MDSISTLSFLGSSIKKVTFCYLLPEIMFKLFPKLKAILESTVITRDFHITLIFFLCAITLCHEKKTR